VAGLALFLSLRSTPLEASVQAKSIDALLQQARRVVGLALVFCRSATNAQGSCAS
jgi:hypothetical protein